MHLRGQATGRVGQDDVDFFGDGGIDDPRGFIHAKDLLSVSEIGLDETFSPLLMRRALRVPREQHLKELLLDMRTSRVHFALVANDDESTAGIVTLDDILEELVGDVADELEPRHLPTEE